LLFVTNFLSIASGITIHCQQGARKVYLATVHPVMIGLLCLLKLYRSGVPVQPSDTQDKGMSAVSVSRTAGCESDKGMTGL